MAAEKKLKFKIAKIEIFKISKMKMNYDLSN